MSAGADAGSQETRAETPEEFEARILAHRTTLAAAVDELAARVDPREVVRSKAEDLGERASGLAGDMRRRAEDLRSRAEATVDRAREGDQGAQGTVAAVVTGAGVATLLVLRALRR